MENKNQHTDVKKIYEILSDKAKNIKIIAVDETGSTNDEVKKLALSGEEKDILFVASSQTKGRGRKGRSFFSPKGTGIYMSLLLHPDCPPEDCMLITPMCAVALAEAVEKVVRVKADIKWVNDIFVSGKKIAGILTEGSFSEGKTNYVIIGIGINLAAPEEGFPEEISHSAGYLTEGNTDMKNQLIGETVNLVIDYLYTLRERIFVEEYKKRLFFLGNRVTVVSAKETYEATAVDVDSDCRLIAETLNGEKRVLDSGEISIKMN